MIFFSNISKNNGKLQCPHYILISFRVIFEKHESAPKSLCYCIEMAPKLCSFLPSGAGGGRCVPNYRLGETTASGWALPITWFLLHGDRLENDRALPSHVVISRPVSTKNVPPGPIILQSPPNHRQVIMGLHKKEPLRIILKQRGLTSSESNETKMVEAN